MRPAVQTQRPRARGRVSRSKIFGLSCVVGVTICLVLNEFPTQTMLAPSALDAAIGVPDTGAQASENLAVLGSPFPDPVRSGYSASVWILRLLSDLYSGFGFVGGKPTRDIQSLNP